MIKRTGSSIIEQVMDIDDSEQESARNDGAESGPQQEQSLGGGFSRDATSRSEQTEEKHARRENADSNGAHARRFPVSPTTPERARIVAGNKGQGASDKFDMLRTQIIREMREKGWRTLGITSPMPRCGKTTVAINLSISIAKGIQKDVVLVDLDLRNPTIAEYLDIEPSLDLSDFLEGRILFREPLVNPGIRRLLILPNNKPYLNSSEMLTSPAALALSKSLRAMEDVQMVVYDLPPALPTDDALAFMPEVDCVLIVLADGISTKQELEDTRQLLRHSNVLGYVLNQFQ